MRKSKIDVLAQNEAARKEQNRLKASRIILSFNDYIASLAWKSVAVQCREPAVFLGEFFVEKYIREFHPNDISDRQFVNDVEDLMNFEDVVKFTPGIFPESYVLYKKSFKYYAIQEDLIKEYAKERAYSILDTPLQGYGGYKIGSWFLNAWTNLLVLLFSVSLCLLLASFFAPQKATLDVLVFFAGLVVVFSVLLVLSYRRKDKAFEKAKKFDNYLDDMSIR